MDDALNEVELTAKQNERLLGLAMSAEASEAGGDSGEKKADALYDILENPLPVDKLILDSLPVVMRGLCRKLRSVAGEAMGELLRNPQTDISTIRGIKEYAKQSGTQARCETEGDAFLAIYYSAIASALVFHDEKITEHSYEDLEQFFSSFAERAWIPEELTGLFTKAGKYCHNKRGKGTEDRTGV